MPVAEEPTEPVNAAERALDELLDRAHLAAPHELPGLLARHGDSLGVSDLVVHLVDLQQNHLTPLLGREGPGPGQQVEALPVDTTLAGRCYQHVEVLTQDSPGGRTRVWLPLLDGAERLGVMSLTVDQPGALTAHGGALSERLRRLASLAAELVMTKTLYGDTMVRLRRSSTMGVAAEMQWSILPPLTFGSSDLTIAGALEPAYQVAGDSVDYAVDAGRAHIAIFDGMGHGLQAAQLAVLAVSAYRNARRSSRSLTDTVHSIDATVEAGSSGAAFTTALLAQLDTDTGAFTWVNAGHPAPLLLRDGKLVKVLDVAPALPLGLGSTAGDDEPCDVGTEHLQPGDRVLFYTDGVVEARSPEGGFFGAERLTDLIIRNLADGLPAPETMRRVVRALLAHQQDQLSDDATLLLLEWRVDNEPSLLF